MPRIGRSAQEKAGKPACSGGSGLGGERWMPYNLRQEAVCGRRRCRSTGDPGPVKKKQAVVTTLLVAATATFVYALLKRRQDQMPSPVYSRPKGGERDGEELLFIGS
jgi:hypothetical protein